MNRIAFFAALFCAAQCHAALLPVYTEPDQGGDRRLILQNFDALGGATVGVAHSDSGSAGAATWQPISGGAASFWLTSYSGPLAMHLELPPGKTPIGVSNFALAFPTSAAWAPLRAVAGPVTFSITDVAETMTSASRGRWSLGVMGQAEGVSATGRYTIEFHQQAPEPQAWVLALLGGLVLRKRS
jgi:hypothetical protein